MNEVYFSDRIENIAEGENANYHNMLVSPFCTMFSNAFLVNVKVVKRKDSMLKA